MNLIKRSLLVALIVLTQSQNVFGGICKNPIAKLTFVIGSLATGKAAYVLYQNYSVDSEVKALKNTCKSLSNGKINPGDKAEDIAKKWTMSGWRIKGSGFNYRPDISIADANFIHIYEPLVVECLYNDLKFREIYIVEEKIIDKKKVAELNPISFSKPEKTAYAYNLKQKNDGQGKPITVMNCDEVPSIDTLKSLNASTESQIKKLLVKMKELEAVAPFDTEKTSFAKLLIHACKIYQKSSYYRIDIDEQIAKIASEDYIDSYKANLVKSLTDFKTLDIDDISDLYLFNSDQLYKDKLASDRTFLLESIKNKFIQLCKNELQIEAQGEPSIFSDLLKKPMGFVKQVAEDIKRNCPDSIKTASEYAKKPLSYLSFKGVKADELHSQIYSTYFEVAVRYARLIKLGKVLSKIINMANGYEDNLSPEALLKKDKEKVNKKISSIIKMVTELKANDKVSYVLLEKIYKDISDYYNGFIGFDLIKIYGSTEFKSLLGKTLRKMLADVKSLSTYFGNNTSIKSDDDDYSSEFSNLIGGFGGSQRINNSRTNIYVDGNLNQSGLETLHACCRSWFVGLNELEKQSKL